MKGENGNWRKGVNERSEKKEVNGQRKGMKERWWIRKKGIKEKKEK